MVLTCTTDPSQNEPGSNGNEGVLHIHLISRTGTSPVDDLVSYSGYSIGGWSYPSAEMQSVYSTAPPNGAAIDVRCNAIVAQSAGAVEYTDCTFGEVQDTSAATSVLDMTLNNLIVRFQWCRCLGNAEHPFIAIAPRSTLTRSASPCLWVK